jgi:hypothetical protein
MRRIGGCIAMLGGAATLAASAAPAPACGCGVGFAATAVSERVYVGFAHGREDLVVSLGLAARTGAAVVLPVPSTPTVGLAPSGRALFSYLARVTAPQTVVVRHVGPPPVSSPQVGGGGTPALVVGTKRIGGYSITRLRGGTATALLEWLGGHGYALSHRERVMIGRYVATGWSFVAIRLRSRAKGLLAPLRLRFPVPAPVYPLRLDRLASTPIDLDLWTVGAHRTRTKHLITDYAGPISGLAPAVPPALRRYLGGGWVTHFEGKPLGILATARDARPVRVADTPFRRVVHEDVYTG